MNLGTVLHGQVIVSKSINLALKAGLVMHGNYRLVFK